MFELFLFLAIIFSIPFIGYYIEMKLELLEDIKWLADLEYVPIGKIKLSDFNDKVIKKLEKDNKIRKMTNTEKLVYSKYRTKLCARFLPLYVKRYKKILR